MSIIELINQYGIGICIVAAFFGIGIIIGAILFLFLLWLLIYSSFLKAIKHDYDIDFELLSDIQENYYKLDIKVSELISNQLSHCCQKSAKDSSRK